MNESMSVLNTTTNPPPPTKRLSIIEIKKSEEEEIFEALVDLWASNKISHETMLKYAPPLDDEDINPWKMFFTWVANW
jgi:hypothetical protein